MNTQEDDIIMALAYYNLKGPQNYSPADILLRKQLRRHFIKYTTNLLGVCPGEVLRILLSLSLKS